MNIIEFIPKEFENIDFDSVETQICSCSPDFPLELKEESTLKINVPEKIVFHSLDEKFTPVLPVCMAYSRSSLREVKYRYFSQQKIHIKPQNEDTVYFANYYDKSTVNKIPYISIEEEEGRRQETKEAQKFSDDEVDNMVFYSGNILNVFYRDYLNVNALDYVQLPIKSGKYEVWVTCYGMESNHVFVEILFNEKENRTNTPNVLDKKKMFRFRID